MVDWDDMYGSAALPKSKIADIAPVCQTLWQLPPVNQLRITYSKENDNIHRPTTTNPKDKRNHLHIYTVLK